MTIRILVINPNTSQDMTDIIQDSAKRHASPDTEIIVIGATTGPKRIDSFLDEAAATLNVVAIISQETANYDAFVIACGSDPGLDAAREITDKPVIGIGEAPMLLSLVLGHKFSIMATDPKDIALDWLQVKHIGLEQRYASTRVISDNALEATLDQGTVFAQLVTQGKKAIVEDNAEVLVLTCAGMGKLDKRLQAELGVPVLEGVTCAVKLAEVLVNYGVKTSKVGRYATTNKHHVLD